MKEMPFDLQGKVALVTGGAGILGKQHSEALLDMGATVYIADIAVDKVQNACAQLGPAAKPLTLDVSCETALKTALEEIIDQDIRLDILINNAAIDAKVGNDFNLPSSRVENFAIEQWNTEIDVGLTGAFLCSKVFGSHMAEKKSGCILNIASDLSVIAPDQRLYLKSDLLPKNQPVKPVTYSVIKTGLIGLTRYLAAYWASDNVRVNALSPGGIYTDQPEDFVKKLSNLVPLGRMARENEYQSAVQFLCSDASSYLTGQNIVIDGGRSII
jgi:NAD(P)-dependent dehydrogenase (short-subunit alcohol dehydrogenase family)